MPTSTLPDWIKDCQADEGPGHFTCDCDTHFPEIVADLKAHKHEVPDPLDQYWCYILSFFARKDAHMAITQSGLSRKADGETPAHKLVKQTYDKQTYGSTANPSGGKARGWIEYSTVELVPEKEVRMGETIDVGGVPHVCVEEAGCRRLRSGTIESGKFRKESFVERPEGKGVAAAEKDARQIFEQVRGYYPG